MLLQGTLPVAVDVPIGQARVRVRVQSIDVLRGLVIALMALDHVRAYFMDIRISPLDLEQTTATLFLTRWITHFCAPIFVFLAGVSAYRYSRTCTRAELTRFLVTRGLWLVVLEWTVVTFALTFNFKYQLGLIMQVIWVIGVSMMVLAALVRFPLTVVGAISFVLIAGHNLFDGIAPEQFGALAPLWSVLHVQGPTVFGFVLYPLIPWTGVLMLGYVLGAVYDREPAERQKFLLTAGAAVIAAFLLIRFVNAYGDPRPWSVQSTFGFTLLSFVNVHKYPPSLLYVLMTLGPALLLLAAFERINGRFTAVLQTFGRVPLLFYVAHLVLVHLAAGLTALALGRGTQILTSVFMFFPSDWGFSLPVIYGIWALVLLALYPLCQWFAEIKRRRTDWWLSYV